MYEITQCLGETDDLKAETGAIIQIQLQNMSEKQLPNPRQFRFRLKTLLFVLIPVSAVLVWIGVQYESALVQRRGVSWARNQNGHIYYDYEKPLPDGSTNQNAIPPGPDFVRNWMGIDFVDSVRTIVLDNKELTDLSPLKDLKRLKHLAIMIDIMPGTDLMPIAGLRELESLTFNSTNLDRNQQLQLEKIRVALPNCKIELGNQVRMQ